MLHPRLDTGYVTQLPFDRDAAAAGHLYHLAGTGDVLIQRKAGCVHHDTGATLVDAPDRGFQ